MNTSDAFCGPHSERSIVDYFPAVAELSQTVSSDFEQPAVERALSRFAAGKPIVENALLLTEVLRSPKLSTAPIINCGGTALVLDLARGSMMLGEPLSGLAVDRFGQLINKTCADAGAGFAYGRWAERREVYGNDLFASSGTDAMRDVHLGVDVFCASGNAVHAPLAGAVHIKANNAQELDYGPMLILEHEIGAGHSFFSLYGHLSSGSVADIEPGLQVKAGEKIAEIGAPPENGNWPPHLHFQLILDLLGLGADFPGVAFPAQEGAWLALSPSPARFFPDCDPGALDGRDRNVRGA